MTEELAQTKRENARLLRKLEHAEAIRINPADYDTQVALAEANAISTQATLDNLSIEPSVAARPMQLTATTAGYKAGYYGFYL
jgi:hypothetical protein